MYTFQPMDNGNIDILENGTSIAQGGPGYSVDYAKSLGYMPTTINSESLSSAPSTSYQTATTAPAYNIDSLYEMTQPEKNASGLVGEIKAINDRLAGKDAYTLQQQQSAGIPDIFNQQDELASQIKLLSNQQQELRNQAQYTIPNVTQLGAEGRGVTAAGLPPITAAELRKNQIAQGGLASQALQLSAQSDVLNNRLTSALRKVELAVNQKYAQDEADLKAKQANLDLILKSPEYSLADKKRAQQQLDAQNQRAQELETIKENTKTIQGLALQALQNGAPAPIVDQIMNAKDLTSAFTTAQGYASKETATSIQEYQFAVRNGYKGSFSQYQNEDANRKVSIAKAGATTYNYGGENLSDAQLTATGIIGGNIPPDLTKNVSFKDRTAVTAYLKSKGYDLTKAAQDWTATQRYLSTLNGAQQTRLPQAGDFSYESLDLVDQLNQDLSQKLSRSGVNALNKAQMALAKQGVYGQEAQSAAVKLDSQISDLISELATVYKGGNSSTDESLKLAAQQLSSQWSQKTLTDAVNLVRKNLAIRRNSIATVGVGGVSNNAYAPDQSSGIPESGP